MSGYTNVWLAWLMWAVAFVWGTLAFLTWDPVWSRLRSWRLHLRIRRIPTVSVEASVRKGYGEAPNSSPPVPGRLDRGIRKAVERLRASQIETFESCEGGAGHAFPEPTIRFYGTPEAG